MNGTIFIDQIKVDAILGIYDNERVNKQLLIIDIELDYDSSQASQSDNIKYAIDYFQITEDIHEYVCQSSFQLIEALAAAIADRILLNKLITKVQVTVAKPEALIKANNVRFLQTKYNTG